MTDDSNKTHSEAYREARAQFDQLRLEERAQFLVEAMLVTIGRGLETAGETISREMEGAINNVRDAAREARDSMRDAGRTPGAAEGASAPTPDYDLDVDDVTPPGGSSSGSVDEDKTGTAPGA